MLNTRHSSDVLSIKLFVLLDDPKVGKALSKTLLSSCLCNMFPCSLDGSRRQVYIEMRSGIGWVLLVTRVRCGGQTLVAESC